MEGQKIRKTAGRRAVKPVQYALLMMCLAGGLNACDDDVDDSEKENQAKCCVEEKTDITKYSEDLKNMFEGKFYGNISDKGESIECAQTGKQFILELILNDPMTCTGLEDEVGPGVEVDCRDAVYGSYQITGQFDAGDNVSRQVKGFAGIRNYKTGTEIFFDLNLEYESDFPREKFESAEDDMTLDYELESFSWSKRHSEDNADKVVWESCDLSVTKHEK